MARHYRVAWYIKLLRAISRVMNPGLSIWTFIFRGPKLALLRHADPKMNIKVHLQSSRIL